MYIYNTTYLVSVNQYPFWLKWLHDEHIPFMLENGFTAPQTAKVLTVEENQDGYSLAVQFQISDIGSFNAWNEQYYEKLLDDIAERFGTDVLPFSTLLEIL